MRRREATSGLRWAKVSRPAPRMTYWLTPPATCSMTRSSIKRARATMDARKRLVACGSYPDAGASYRPGRQLQTDLVFEYMRRRIDLDMHFPPQGQAAPGVIRNATRRVP